MVCATIGKILLGIINTIILLVSIAFTGVGAILIFVPKLLTDTLISSAQAAIEEINNNAGGTVVADPEKYVGDLAEIPFIYDVGVTLFVLGVFLFAVSILGCCGVCYSSCCRILLLVFAVLLIILMIVEIVMGSMFLVPDSGLHDNIRKRLKEQITEGDGYGAIKTNLISVVMNVLQAGIGCCGVDDWRDFETSSPPPTCEDASKNIGCYTELMDLMTENMLYAGLGLAFLLAFQLVLVIFAIVIFKDAAKVGIV